MWQFPDLPGKLSAEQVLERLESQGVTVRDVLRTVEKNHIFTHVEWHMMGYEVILPIGAIANMAANGEKNGMNELFLAPRDEIDDRYAVPTAYRAYRPYM